MILRNPRTFVDPHRTHWLLCTLIFLAAVLLGACQSKPEAPEQEPDAGPAVSEAPKIDPVVLRELLEQADAAIADNHLTYPMQGSAFAIYQQILALEPGQQDAQRGLEHIVEQYIALAMAALERDQFASARSMLSRARIIDPEHPSIEPTDEQIRLLSNATRKKLKMEQADLNERSQGLASDLAAMANVSEQENCRFVISAKNDVQGRWIYQQLAQGAPGSRIRAELRVRMPASVERICFPV